MILSQEINNDILVIYKDNMKKIVYGIAGIIIGIAIIMYFIPNINLSNLNLNNITFKPDFNYEALKEPEPIQISIKNIDVRKDGENVKIKTSFGIFNPNNATLLLELVRYNIFLDNVRIISGDIGEKPEGFVDSQQGIYPIIGNSNLVLKDEKEIQNEKRIATVWNKLLNSNSSNLQYIINGTFGYKQSSSFQSTGQDMEFSLKFP